MENQSTRPANEMLTVNEEVNKFCQRVCDWLFDLDRRVAEIENSVGPAVASVSKNLDAITAQMKPMLEAARIARLRRLPSSGNVN